MAGDYWGWQPYVPVAERRLKAMRALEKRRKQGYDIAPVRIEGRKIATTFWGLSWCENLERYSDYANRLPRGRTYVRNGSVVDLQIGAGEIQAHVSGTSLYRVKVTVKPVVKTRWKAICCDCGSGIDSLVELLQGKLSKAVMERICRQREGLFPSPAEIDFSCSCPDSAYMCKHVAAVLYGIGARFDLQPELLFRLRGVDEKDLIAKAGSAIPVTKKGPGSKKILAESDLAGVFGLDMEAEPAAPRKKAAVKKKAVAKKKAAPKRKGA